MSIKYLVRELKGMPETLEERRVGSQETFNGILYMSLECSGSPHPCDSERN